MTQNPSTVQLGQPQNFVPAARLLDGQEFASSQTLRQHPQLPVLSGDVAFTKRELDGDFSVGNGSLAGPTGPIGTVRLQFGGHQAYILVNLSDAEVIHAFKAWRSARFVPLFVNVDGQSGLIRIDVPFDWGSIVLARGKARPMDATTFALVGIQLITSGALARQASSDIPAHPKLERVSALLLATKETESAADAVERACLAELNVSSASLQ